MRCCFVTYHLWCRAPRACLPSHMCRMPRRVAPPAAAAERSSPSRISFPPLALGPPAASYELGSLLASQSSETPCTSGSCWQTNAAPPRSPSPRGSLLLRRQPLLLGMQGLLPQGQPREAGLVAWRPRLRQAQRPGRTAFGALASQCERSHAAGAAAAASAASGPPVPRTHPQAGQAASGCVSC